mgnify:CR=1 FL=1
MNKEDLIKMKRRNLSAKKDNLDVSNNIDQTLLEKYIRDKKFNEDESYRNNIINFNSKREVKNDAKISQQIDINPHVKEMYPNLPYDQAEKLYNTNMAMIGSFLPWPSRFTSAIKGVQGAASSFESLGSSLFQSVSKLISRPKTEMATKAMSLHNKYGNK